ncbi:SCO family protein [Granulosicoccus sp. 3-233]|uniref:SCO family protein n=1 Tax=Granulosicoccus sp. 3-233 TaxID=3417969 RepID=UPI003D344875
MANTQSGKALPLVIIAVVALAAGAILYGFLNGSPSSDGSSSAPMAAAADSEQLASLQETLNTTLALPIDFKSVEAFELQDANGNTVTESILDDRWSLMFFGYTHCPDVCPITLQIMKNMVTKLESQGREAPQIIFVTVDPVRDTAEVMKRYIDYFNEDFIGITGEQNRIHDMTRQLGIVASFTANDEDPENYIVDHSASLLLVDPQRRLRGKVSPPLDVDNIIADYLNVTSSPS